MPAENGACVAAMTVKRQKARLRFCTVSNIRNQLGTVVKSPFLDKMCTPMSTVSGPAGCIYIYIHTHIFIYIYIHTFIHLYFFTFIHSYIHAFMHSCIHTFIHSYSHTFIHSCIPTFIHTYVHTCIHSFIHTSIHSKFIHSFIHSYIHINDYFVGKFMEFPGF